MLLVTSFLHPVSTVTARYAWDHDVPFEAHTREKKGTLAIFLFSVSLLQQVRLINSSLCPGKERKRRFVMNDRDNSVLLTVLQIFVDKRVTFCII